MEINAITTAIPVNLISAGLIWLGSTASAQAALIINEIDYDQPGSDTAEFIELHNPDTNPVALEGYTLELVNGSNGSVYGSFELSGLLIAAQGYLVLCSDPAAVANCSIDTAAGSWIQNGGSDGDAVALLYGTTLVDSVVYEGIGASLGPYAEGGSFAASDSNSIILSIARLPDGLDTDFNAGDFDTACLTPGSPNLGGTGDCSTSVNPVPVPAAAWLFGSGLIGLIAVSRRRPQPREA